MTRSSLMKLSIFAATALWLVTGAVIPCLCPSDMPCNISVTQPVATTQPEQPVKHCAACCDETSDTPCPTPPSNPTQSNKFHCSHTAERLNPGIATDNIVNLVPATADFVYGEIEILNNPSLFISPTPVDTRFEDALPALYARTLPLLS